MSLQVIPENQARYQHNPGHFAYQETLLCQQPLKSVPCAWNPALPDFPLAESNMQATHAAKAARRAHTGGVQPSGERFPPFR